MNKNTLNKGLLVNALVAVVIVMAGVSEAKAANPVHVDAYGFNGTSYSFNDSGINFGTSSHWQWHPVDDDFIAILTSELSVSSTATYNFTVKSDDGSFLFIDGIEVVKNVIVGENSGSIPLTAGIHAATVFFYQCCGGQSGLDVALPAGVSYVTAVPEPQTYAMFLAGLGVMGFMARRRKTA